MARRTFSETVRSMILFLRQLRPNVDTKEGTFTRDVVIDAPASEFDLLYNSLDNVSRSQSPNLAFANALDNLARNHQKQRKGARRAVGTITFYRIAVPTDTYVIPRGTTVTSKGSNVVSAQQYVTTQEVSLSTLNWNAATGRYEVDAPMRAVVGGTAANVPAGAISALVSTVAGVAGCYNNSPITSGANRETDTELAARLREVINGNNVGTTPGYYTTVAAHPSVTDALIVTPETSGISKRAMYGTIDILVRGALPAQPATETYTYTSGVSFYTPSKQPLYGPTSGSFSLQGSTTGALVLGSHYNVIKDVSVYAGSTQAVDKFSFIGGLSSGETLTFTYSYNSLIETLQTLVDDETKKSVTADVLVREAKRRMINLTATIEPLPGYTASVVAANVVTAMTTALNAYTIGEEVQQSDLIAIVAAVTGVDDVAVPFSTFEEDSETGAIAQDGDGNLVMPPDSYAIANTINILTK